MLAQMVGAGASVKRFQLTPEPDDFDTRCRQPGVRWLQEHPGYSRPKDYWSLLEDQLRNAFSGLCAYSVMRIMKGQVDHFVPIALRQRLRSTGWDWLTARWSCDIAVNSSSYGRVESWILRPLISSHHSSPLRFAAIPCTAPSESRSSR